MATVFAVFSATFLTIGNGIQMAWPSPSVPKLLSNDLGYHITEEEASYIVMLAPLGYILGSPLCGVFLDRIGRKYTLLLLAPVQIITWCIIAFSQQAASLYIARILMGITDSGMFTALPAYIGEVVEPKVRGRAGASTSLGIVLGVLLINLYGSFVSVRTAAYISLICPVLFLVTFAWTPESPYYLIGKRQDDKARDSLKWFRRQKNVEEELLSIKKAVQRQLAEPGRFSDIFTVPSNLKAFIILVTLRTVQQFAGTNVIGFYLQVLFKTADLFLSPPTSAITCNSLTLIFTCVGSFLIDYFGRRAMVLWSCTGSAITLIILGVYFYLLPLGYDLSYFKWPVLIVFGAYFIFGSLGLVAVPTIMMGELLPSNIKAKALTLITVHFGMCTAAATKLFYWTNKEFGAHIPFGIFALSCIFGFTFTYIYVPETKGKSLNEIQQILKGTKAVKEQKVLLEIRQTEKALFLLDSKC